MKIRTKKICISGIILGMLLLTTSVSSAVPALDKMVLNPAVVTPQSDVTFTADIEDYDFAKNVYLIVEECTFGFCYADSFNESMSDNGEGKFEKKITLKHDDATEIKYHVEIEGTDGEWTASKVTYVNLDTTGSSNGGDNDSNSTPGFELIFLLMAVIVGFVSFRKKR